MNNNPASSSFLDETQIEGKSSGKSIKINLNQAIENVYRIHDPKILTEIQKEIAEDKDMPPRVQECYCQDCRGITTPTFKEIHRRKKASIKKMVCSNCQSKKLAFGTHDGLSHYYHLEKNKN